LYISTIETRQSKGKKKPNKKREGERLILLKRKRLQYLPVLDFENAWGIIKLIVFYISIFKLWFV